MEEFDQRKYQTVILAALLHDVGKFIEKQFSKKEGKHPWYSEEFIEKHLSFIKVKDWVEFDLVKLLAKRHHEYKNAFESEYLVQDINEEKHRALAYLVSRADSMSSRERSDRKFDKLFLKREAQRFPLDSIFGELSLQEEDFYDKEWFYFYDKIAPLEPENTFPNKKKKDKKKELLKQNDYKDQYDQFINDIESLRSEDDFTKFYISLLSLLEKYCWCVPSAANEELADISLYDHLKTTSAFAACLYQYHNQAGIGFDEALVKKRGNYKFLLLGGHMAGIQNYIYQLKGTKGLSKRLRARSFFITVLVEAIVHWILDYFKLPVSCCLVNGGGRFILVLPNTTHVKSELEKISKEISTKLYHRFFGEINLNLTWEAEDSEKNGGGLATEFTFKIYNFFRSAEIIYDRLEKEKFRRLNGIVLEKGQWNRNKFVISEELWRKFGEHKKVCQICGRFPAEIFSDNGTIETCELCNQDEKIGKVLPFTRFISFAREQISNTSINIFDNVFVNLWKENHGWGGESSRIYLLKVLPYSVDYSADSKKQLPTGTGATYSFLANYVPIMKQAEKFKEKYARWLDLKDEEIENNAPYSFSSLAVLSIDNEREKGSPLIGILKADIDRLGLLFSRGFKGKRRIELEDRVIPLDRITPSRFLTMSRMIDLFFSGWIDSSLRKRSAFETLPVNDFSKIYTVYSGGDDLLLVGPWETIINFSIELNKKFRKFTCDNNNNITLSAGIAVIKPKMPVNRWAFLADELLNSSKEKGRDRLTIFDTTVTWDEVEEIKHSMEILHHEMNKESPLISMAFLYRLLRYSNLYMNFTEKGDIRGLLYHSQLSYDIQRNIVAKYVARFGPGDREDKKTEFMKSDIYEFLKPVVELYECRTNRRMETLRIPILWTIYKNRRL